MAHDEDDQYDRDQGFDEATMRIHHIRIERSANPNGAIDTMKNLKADVRARVAELTQGRTGENGQQLPALRPYIFDFLHGAGFTCGIPRVAGAGQFPIKNPNTSTGRYPNTWTFLVPSSQPSEDDRINKDVSAGRAAKRRKTAAEQRQAEDQRYDEEGRVVED